MSVSLSLYACVCVFVCVCVLNNTGPFGVQSSVLTVLQLNHKKKKKEDETSMNV